MRAGAPAEVLAGACLWRPRVTSWLGGRLLAAQVPILGGKVTAKTTDDVLEQLTLTVARMSAPEAGGDVVDWRPTSTDAPLARFGQTLDVSIILTSVITGQVWETRIGRYQIKDWDDDDAGLITVKGESLIARPRDDKLRTLSSPSGTFMSEVRRLLPPGMGVSFDTRLVDRTVPQSMSWSTDRWKNLTEIAAAWPALIRVDEWGQLVFRAPLPAVPVPVLTLRDGESGTLISAPRADSRADAYNLVIATSSSTDAADVQGIAAVTAGPMSINGPYGAVVKEWSSPLLETQSQANASAATMLANSIRPAQSVPVTIAPDPRIQLDDAVAVLRGEDAPMWGWVTGYEMPLTAKDGAMRIDVGTPS
ncbi:MULTISPECIES: hypothetical protein [unclassified Microbacterium]|uniref:hypothetical protein n=1 Tax=unclassified Microbacterium TaxID=2609290 RepID=UPI00301B11C0